MTIFTEKSATSDQVQDKTDSFLYIIAYFFDAVSCSDIENPIGIFLCGAFSPDYLED